MRTDTPNGAARMAAAARRDERRATEWRKRNARLFVQADLTETLQASIVRIIAKKLVLGDDYADFERERLERPNREDDLRGREYEVEDCRVR
jgi:hypothetical protein